MKSFAGQKEAIPCVYNRRRCGGFSEASTVVLGKEYSLQLQSNFTVFMFSVFQPTIIESWFGSLKNIDDRLIYTLFFDSP